MPEIERRLSSRTPHSVCQHKISPFAFKFHLPHGPSPSSSHALHCPVDMRGPTPPPPWAAFSCHEIQRDPIIRMPLKSLKPATLVVPEFRLPCAVSLLSGWTAALTSGFSEVTNATPPPISLKYFELSPPRSLGCLAGSSEVGAWSASLCQEASPSRGSGYLQVLPGLKVCSIPHKVSPEFVTPHTCLACICTNIVLSVGVFYWQGRVIL